MEETISKENPLKITQILEGMLMEVDFDTLKNLRLVSSQPNQLSTDLIGSENVLSFCPFSKFQSSIRNSDIGVIKHLKFIQNFINEISNGRYKNLEIPSEILGIENFEWFEANFNFSKIVAASVENLIVKEFNYKSKSMVKLNWEQSFFKLIQHKMNLKRLRIFNLPIPKVQRSRKRNRKLSREIAIKNAENLIRLIESLEELEVDSVDQKTIRFLTKLSTRPELVKKLNVNRIQSELTNPFLCFYSNLNCQWRVKEMTISLAEGICIHLIKQFLNSLTSTLTSLNLTFESFARAKCFSCSAHDNDNTLNVGSFLPKQLTNLNQLTLTVSPRCGQNPTKSSINPETFYKTILVALTYPELRSLTVEHDFDIEAEEDLQRSNLSLTPVDLVSVCSKSLRHVTLKCNETLLLNSENFGYKLWPNVTTFCLENASPNLVSKFLTWSPQLLRKLKLVWNEPWAAHIEFNWDIILFNENGPSIRDLKGLRDLEIDFNLRSFSLGLTEGIVIDGLLDLPNLERVTLYGVKITREAAGKFRNLMGSQTRLYVKQRGPHRNFRGVKGHKLKYINRFYYVHPHPFNFRHSWHERKPELASSQKFFTNREPKMEKVETRRQSQRKEIVNRAVGQKFKFREEKVQRRIKYKFHEYLGCTHNEFN